MNVSNPSVTIRQSVVIHIEGQSFAELVAHQALIAEHLKRTVRCLSIVNADVDERLTELQLISQTMFNATSQVAFELLRIATEQGLVLESTGQAEVKR